MFKLNKILLGYCQVIVWLFLVSLFFDAANIDDFFPSIECVHADDAEILAVSENYQDSFSINFPGGSSPCQEYKAHQKHHYLRYDLDSPVHLDYSSIQHSSYIFHTLIKPQLSSKPEFSHSLFIEFCSLLI